MEDAQAVQKHKTNTNEVEKEGVLRAILGYETRHNVTIGPSGMVHDTFTVTNLEILIDGEEPFQIAFGTYVGKEVLDQMVRYREITETKSGPVVSGSSRMANQVTKVQALLPLEEGAFAPYQVIDVRYEGQ